MLSLEPHFDATLLKSTFLLVICTLPWLVSLEVTPLFREAEETFPPPGWCFMLSVEPILERTFRMSGAVPGRLVVVFVVVVVLVVEEVARGVRGAAGFFSADEGVAGLDVVVRGRGAAVVVVVVRGVVVLGLVASVEVFRAPGFLSSPGLLSVFEAKGFLAVTEAAVRVVVVVVRVVVVVFPAAVVPFLAAAALV